MSSPPLNDSLIVEAKYDCNRCLDWYSRDPGFDRNKLQDRDLTATQEAGFAKLLARNKVKTTVLPNREDRSLDGTAGLEALPLPPPPPTDLVYYDMSIYLSISSTGVPSPPIPQKHP